MKKVWGWIKANIAVVISTLLILLVLPTGWFFSSSWSEKIRDEEQKKVKADYDKINTLKVTYTSPVLEPGAPAVEATGVAPNARLTEYFKDLNAKVKTEAESVVKAAEEHNQRGHKVLVEGLLPSGTGPDAQSRAFALANLVVHMPPEEPSKAYTALFESNGAGGPRPGKETYETIHEAEVREVAVYAGATNRQMTPEEQAKVTRKLVELRASDYQARAREFSYYASPDCLGNQIPHTRAKEAPSIRDVFGWQADYWLVSDLLGAVRAADTDAGGRPLTVDRSPVKKIEKITIKPSVFSASRQDANYPGQEEQQADAAPAPAPGAQVAPDYSRSITGRWSGPGNGVYDVRRAELVMIVSSKNLPAVFDAFARSNFMTIIDCDLYDVDLWQELERGYYFGPESVVRAKLEVEVVWLRSWTTPYMPPEIKKKLGIPETPPADAPAAPK